MGARHALRATPPAPLEANEPSPPRQLCSGPAPKGKLGLRFLGVLAGGLRRPQCRSITGEYATLGDWCHLLGDVRQSSVVEPSGVSCEGDLTLKRQHAPQIVPECTLRSHGVIRMRR